MPQPRASKAERLGGNNKGVIPSKKKVEVQLATLSPTRSVFLSRRALSALTSLPYQPYRLDVHTSLGERVDPVRRLRKEPPQRGGKEEGEGLVFSLLRLGIVGKGKNRVSIGIL